MPHPFDDLTISELQERASAKWQRYPKGVLPLWVADMDFPPAEPIVKAIQLRAASGNLGYPVMAGEPGLLEAIQDRLLSRFGWRVNQEAIWLTGGIIQGLYLSCLACASEGEEVIVQTPIYPPFLSAIQDTGRVTRHNELRFDGHEYEIDFDGLEALVTPATRLLMLCNPHNPSGRVFRRDELERLADFVLRHRLWVVSDELHSDLVFEGQHIPFASINDEVAQRTLTLLGPTKTFNIAGLKIGIAISQNAKLLERYQRVGAGLVKPPNVLAQAATLAAYREGDAWLRSTLEYLDGNRTFVKDFLRGQLPQVKYALPQGTYLAWLDFRALELGDGLYRFLLEDAKVALNDGPQYGPGGEGFSRLNFATSRAVVEEALNRIVRALNAR